MSKTIPGIEALQALHLALPAGGSRSRVLQSVYHKLTIHRDLTQLTKGERASLEQALTVYRERGDATEHTSPKTKSTGRRKDMGKKRTTKRTESATDDARSREWLHPDGTCIICEKPEKDHNLEERKACIAEYTRLAPQENEKLEIERKEASKMAKGRKAPTGGGRAALVFDGHTSTEIIDNALAGKVTTLTFGDAEEARHAAYTFYGMRRRKDLLGKVSIEINSATNTVEVGPRSGKAPKKAAKAAAPKTAKVKKSKKAKRGKSSKGS